MRRESRTVTQVQSYCIIICRAGVIKAIGRHDWLNWTLFPPVSRVKIKMPFKSKKLHLFKTGCILLISWHNSGSYSSRTVPQPRWEEMRRRWPLERLLESLFGMLTTWEKQSFKCVLSPDMSTTTHPPHREEARGRTSTIWAIYLVQLFFF